MQVESIESLCQRARQAIKEGEVESARQLYLQALGFKSDSPEVHYGLATVCFLLDDLDSAAHHFKEVTRLDPSRPGAHINLGAVYNRMKQYDEAIKSLRRGIQLDARRAEGYYNLGVVYRNTGQNSLAVQSYLEATRVNPRMIDAHQNLANLYLVMGSPKQAAYHYRQVLQLRPNWDKALEGLAQAEAGDQTKAAEAPAPPAPAAVDPDRHVDPQAHATVLGHLHQATIDSETQGRQFMQILEQEIQPLLTELSNALLRPAASATLGPTLQKFETAVENMRKVRQHLQNSMDRVRNLGDRLIQS